MSSISETYSRLFAASYGNRYFFSSSPIRFSTLDKFFVPPVSGTCKRKQTTNRHIQQYISLYVMKLLSVGHTYMLFSWSETSSERLLQHLVRGLDTSSPLLQSDLLSWTSSSFLLSVVHKKEQKQPLDTLNSTLVHVFGLYVLSFSSCFWITISAVGTIYYCLAVSSLLLQSDVICLYGFLIL